MRVEDSDWTTTSSFAGCDQITDGVITNFELVFAKETLDEFGAFLFLFLRRVDFRNRDPLAKYRVVVLVDVIECDFYARVVLDELY